MKLLDRMIYKAMDGVYTYQERMILAFVGPDGEGGYRAACHLWNGEKGAGVRILSSTHPTLEGAQEAVDRVAEEYPNRYGSQVVITDDLGE